MHMLKRVFFLLVFDWKHGEIVEVIIVFISSLYRFSVWFTIGEIYGEAEGVGGGGRE